ncbi:3-hydroxyacyl-CoA dehydrogenase [Myroides sp. LJL110]
MEIRNVTIAGSGVLGYQIAFQCAFKGFRVSVYDINEQIIDKAKDKFDSLAKSYKKDLQASDSQIQQTKNNLSYFTDLALAVQDADLLIEAVPEDPKIKFSFYKQLAPLAPEKTIFATNSSTLLPSDFAHATKRPDRFLALHFANDIRIHNIAEIMGSSQTKKEVFDQVVEFAKAIGMVPLPLYKEQPGYILNSLLVPFLEAATSLVVNDIADAKTIDKTWMISTGSPLGPFGILDIVGITTVYNINKLKADSTKSALALKTIEYLKREFLDKNRLGVSTGQGFYNYPNPEYQDKDFLK